MCPPNSFQFDKNLLVLAAKFHTISPAAYKMLRQFQSISLPASKVIKQMLPDIKQDSNLESLFYQMKPKQRLVNILFDKVNLVQTMHFSGDHIIGQTQNFSDDALATHTLLVEIVCHFDGCRIYYEWSLSQNSLPTIWETLFWKQLTLFFTLFGKTT